MVQMVLNTKSGPVLLLLTPATPEHSICVNISFLEKTEIPARK